MMLSTLAAEDITGYLNRRTAQDPECHPVMRELSKIHIIEEARHRGYARQYLKQNWPHIGKFRRSMARRHGLLLESFEHSLRRDDLVVFVERQRRKDRWLPLLALPAVKLALYEFELQKPGGTNVRWGISARQGLKCIKT